MQDILIKLIQISLGQKKVLSKSVCVDDWDEILQLAMNQSLAGICFIGIQKLGADPDEGYLRIGMSEDTYFTWVGLAARIQVQNELVNGQCLKLQSALRESGMRSSILKGQGLATLYPKELSEYRQSGDIDVYVDCGFHKALAFARELLQKEVEWDYKHLHLEEFPDTSVELHYRTEVLTNMWKNYKLQKWIKNNQQMLFTQSEYSKLTTPNIEFNIVYLLVHIYKHFLVEGIGLRQFMDYYFVLQASSKSERDSAMRVIANIGLTHFAESVLYVLQKVFLYEVPEGFFRSDKKEGQYLLKEILEGGNFGHHDKRNNSAHWFCANNWKVVDVQKRLRHSFHLLGHYTVDAMWYPAYMVWHKCWKVWCV